MKLQLQSHLKQIKCILVGMLKTFLDLLTSLIKALNQFAAGHDNFENVQHLASKVISVLQQNAGIRDLVNQLHANGPPGANDLMKLDRFLAIENDILRPLNLSMNELRKLLSGDANPPAMEHHPADWFAKQLQVLLLKYPVSLTEARQFPRKLKKKRKSDLLSGASDVTYGIAVAVADAVAHHHGGDVAWTSYVKGISMIARGIRRLR